RTGRPSPPCMPLSTPASPSSTPPTPSPPAGTPWGTTRRSSRRRCAPGPVTPRRWSWPPRAASPGGQGSAGAATARPTTCAQRSRSPWSTWRPTPSTCTTGTADRSIRYAEGVQTLAALREEGLIREIGISNANLEEIEVAREVLGDGGLAAVQNQFSLTFFHTSREELAHCGTHGIAFVPFSPLGGTGGGARGL